MGRLGASWDFVSWLMLAPSWALVSKHALIGAQTGDGFFFVPYQITLMPKSCFQSGWTDPAFWKHFKPLGPSGHRGASGDLFGTQAYFSLA